MQAIERPNYLSSFEKIAENSSTICIGAVAVALGDPSGGTLTATGLAGLGVLGLGLSRSSADRACKAAADRTLTTLKQSLEFADADLIRAQALLDDHTATGAISTEDLRAAYKQADGPARADALAAKLHALLPFDGDADLTKRLLKLALQSSMRACLPHVEEQAIQELIVETARQTDGMVTVLARVEEKVDELPDKIIKELVRNGYIAKPSDGDAITFNDLRSIAGNFGGEDLAGVPDIMAFLQAKAEDMAHLSREIEHMRGRSDRIDDIAAEAAHAVEHRDLKTARRLLESAR